MNTIFKRNYGNAVLDFHSPVDILLEMCHLVTNITAVNILGIYGPKSPAFNLRMSLNYFLLKTSDQNTKMIVFGGAPRSSWMLWKTEFRINSYRTISNDKNFTKNTNKFVEFIQETFHVTILETKYASGNRA